MKTLRTLLFKICSKNCRFMYIKLFFFTIPALPFKRFAEKVSKRSPDRKRRQAKRYISSLFLKLIKHCPILQRKSILRRPIMDCRLCTEWNDQAISTAASWKRSPSGSHKPSVLDLDHVKVFIANCKTDTTRCRTVESLLLVTCNFYNLFFVF